jgi:hypothetical protein
MNNQYDRKVTYIDELPELDDLGAYSNNQPNDNMSLGMNMIPNDIAEKYQKVIRNSHVPSAESGMFYQNPPMYQQQQIIPSQPRQIPSQVVHQYESYQPSPNNYIQQQVHQPQQIQQQYGQVIENQIRENYSNISCLDFANHVKGCPICSKFYNTDKTPYIIAIVILSIVCLLLLRKVLNM